MKKFKIYLDTSVINFLFANDVPELKKITEEFFQDYIEKNKYIVYVSDIVIREIEKTKNKIKRKKLLKIISKYGLRILRINEETNKLANIYIKMEIIPAKKIEDAQHIAISTCNKIDILLSWNFKHLANIKKQNDVKKINKKEGYFYSLILTNPMEVMYESKE